MSRAYGPLADRPDQPMVGLEVSHESADLHVTGAALYTQDLTGRTLGTLHAWPVQAPHAHARVTGERGPERRDGGQPVRLELLAAEAAPHAQALYGDLVRGQAEHVGHDVLGLRGMLRAGLDEDLPFSSTSASAAWVSR